MKAARLSVVLFIIVTSRRLVIKARACLLNFQVHGAGGSRHMTESFLFTFPEKKKHVMLDLYFIKSRRPLVDNCCWQYEYRESELG